MNGLPRTTMTALFVVVVALLAGFGVVSSIGTDTSPAETPPEIISATNSTNYIVPDRSNITRQEYTQVDVDLATVAAVDGERLEGRHDELVFEHLWEQNSDEVATAAVVDQLSNRTTALERRQHRLFNEYSRGDLSTRTLVRGLTRLHVDARIQEANIEQFIEERSDVPSASFLSVKPSMLRNPVSEQLVAAQTGVQRPVGVYVVGAPDSLVAATVVDDTFYRQATLRAERNAGGDDQFAESDLGRAQAAGDRASTLYSDRPDSVRGFAGTNMYKFSVNHSHGELTGYLDGSTTNPVHEYQYKRPVVEVPADTTSNATESFRLNVQYTDSTGPMAVSLLGTGVEVPPTVTVSVNGDTVGTLDGSGQLWTVQPMGEFTVTATTEEGKNVTVSVPDS